MENKNMKSRNGDRKPTDPRQLIFAWGVVLEEDGHRSSRQCLCRELERLRLEQQTLRRSLRDNAVRISEQEGTLRQLKTPDYQALRNRRACLCRERSRLEEKGSCRRLDRIHHEIMALDRQLGKEAIQESCRRRLLKLRENHQQMQKRLTWAEETIRKLEDEKKRQDQIFSIRILALLEGDNGSSKNGSWPDPQQ